MGIPEDLSALLQALCIRAAPQFPYRESPSQWGTWQAFAASSAVGCCVHVWAPMDWGRHSALGRGACTSPHAGVALAAALRARLPGAQHAAWWPHPTPGWALHGSGMQRWNASVWDGGRGARSAPA